MKILSGTSNLKLSKNISKNLKLKHQIFNVLAFVPSQATNLKITGTCIPPVVAHIGVAMLTG